jgi:Variant SH3 domain
MPLIKQSPSQHRQIAAFSFTIMKAKALFDCTADDIGELSFKEGDVLVDVVNSAEDGWYEGRVEGSTVRGLFPYNYVEKLDEPTASSEPLAHSGKASRTVVEDNISASEPKIAPSTSWSVLTKAETNEARRAIGGEVKNSSESTPEKKKPPKEDVPATIPLTFSNQPTAAVNLFARRPDPSSPNTPPIIRPKPVISPKPASLEKTTGVLRATSDLSKSPKAKEPMTNTAYRNRSMSSPLANPSATFGSSRPINTPKTLPLSSEDSNLKPSQLKNKETYGVVLKKPSPSIPTKTSSLRSTELQGAGISSKFTDDKTVDSSNKEDENSEDDDGYQLVKPSSLRQRGRAQTTADIQSRYGGVRLPFANPGLVKQGKSMSPELKVIKPSTVNSSPSVISREAPKAANATALASESTTNVLDLMSTTNNPAPRLPSRPTSNRRSRRPPSSKSTTEVDKIPSSSIAPSVANKTSTIPPPIKAKPLAKPTTAVVEKKVGVTTQNDDERKPFSVSNLARQFDTNKSPISPSVTPPATKPKSASLSLPQVPGKPLGLSNANNLTPALQSRPIPKPNTDSTSNNSSSFGSNAPPVLRPKPSQYQAGSSLPSNTNIDSSRSPKDTITATRPSYLRNVSSNTSSRKKAAALPPPATAAIPSNARLRYEALFDRVHDRNRVDGQTIKMIWQKSKLNDKVLADVWKHCDKEATGLLDKPAFVQGMGEIDERLRREMTKQQQRTK